MTGSAPSARLLTGFERSRLWAQWGGIGVAVVALPDQLDE
jgi:hypothetical protein